LKREKKRSCSMNEEGTEKGSGGNQGSAEMA